MSSGKHNLLTFTFTIAIDLPESGLTFLTQTGSNVFSLFFLIFPFEHANQVNCLLNQVSPAGGLTCRKLTFFSFFRNQEKCFETFFSLPWIFLLLLKTLMRSFSPLCGSIYSYLVRSKSKATFSHSHSSIRIHSLIALSYHEKER